MNNWWFPTFLWCFFLRVEILQNPAAMPKLLILFSQQKPGQYYQQKETKILTVVTTLLFSINTITEALLYRVISLDLRSNSKQYHHRPGLCSPGDYR